MRLPWQAAQDSAEDTGRQSPDDNGVDPYWDSVGDDDDNDSDDPLAGLEPDARAAVEAYARSQVEAARTEQTAMLEAARSQGFEITPTGVAVRDPRAASQWFGTTMTSRPAPAEQPAPAPPAHPSTDPEPDRWTEPEAHDRWVIRQAQQSFQEQIAPLVQQNQSLAEVVRQREVASALERARGLTAGNPMLETAMQHPDFNAGFAEMTSRMKPEQLIDPVQLRYVAAMVASDLDMARQPAAAPVAPTLTRQPTGRTVSAAMARESAGMSAPMTSSVASQQDGDGGRIAPEVRAMVDRINRSYQAIGMEPMTIQEWEIAGSTPLYDEWLMQHRELEAVQARRGRR